MKAEIIFKEGSEGEMTIDAIKGIAIPRIDGATILVYPKYKKCELLAYERRHDWKEPEHTEIEALLEDTDKSKERTDALLELDSPAAKFVRSIGKQFNIPSLLTAGTIKKYCKEINTLAKQIDGADVLPEGSGLWSCLRRGTGNAWYANGGHGFFDSGSMCSAYVLVPVALREEQKPAELPKSKDYGIDGLYAAVDILQKTLGKVGGYQTDDGILEHKCAISAVKELYEQQPAEWSED